jgi:outer membrane biosynthesis protein TonB
MECLGLHNKPNAEVHLGHKLTGPKKKKKVKEEKEKKEEKKEKEKNEEKKKKKEEEKKEKKKKEKKKKKENKKEKKKLTDYLREISHSSQSTTKFQLCMHLHIHSQENKCV